MVYPDYMIDIETTGTAPDRTAMIQLAAVRFNFAERAVDTTSMFNRCLLVPAHRFWDQGTREWWGKQKKEVLRDIYSRMEDPKTVLEAFNEWVGPSQDVPRRFWAKPTHFDFSFMQSYFKDYDLHFPFHYRSAIDLNSFIRGVGGDPGAKPFENDFKGDAHNAIVDVLNQIDTLFKAVKHYETQ